MAAKFFNVAKWFRGSKRICPQPFCRAHWCVD